MPEFILRDGIDDSKLIVVSKDHYAANMALFQYLTNRAFRICVLKYGFIQHRYIVIGDQGGCDRWLEEEFDRDYRESRTDKKPVIERVASLDAEAVSEWAKDILFKQIWTYYISHEFDDEFNRSGPTMRCYDIGLRYFTTVSPGQEDDPVYKELREAGCIEAHVTKEEAI